MEFVESGGNVLPGLGAGEPWGTPCLTEAGVELQPAWATNCVRSKRFEWKMDRAESVRPRCSDRRVRRI